jgi:hypothetical protein
VGNDGVGSVDLLGHSAVACKYPCKYEKMQAGHAWGVITCDDGFSYKWHFYPDLNDWRPSALWGAYRYGGIWEEDLSTLGFSSVTIGLWKTEAVQIKELVESYIHTQPHIYGLSNPFELTCQGAALMPVDEVIGTWERLRREFE